MKKEFVIYNKVSNREIKRCSSMIEAENTISLIEEMDKVDNFYIPDSYIVKFEEHDE